VKPLKQQCDLQLYVLGIINRLAPEISGAVQIADEIDWDGNGKGRANWTVGFIAPNGLPPDPVVNQIISEIYRLQNRYDLGLRVTSGESNSIQ
jgi:hypothetical protein